MTENELAPSAPDDDLPRPPPGAPPLPGVNVPDSFRSFSTRAPTAAVTSFWPATAATADDFSVPRPPPTRMLWLTLVLLPPGGPPRKRNRGPPPEPAVGDFVTVMSVPTP